jgi:hypothetical protein
MHMKHGGCKLCERNASYGNLSDNLRQYCVKHKEKEMVNLTKRYCCKCSHTASFGFAFGSSAVYCSEHKIDGMIHTSVRRNNGFIMIN